MTTHGALAKSHATYIKRNQQVHHNVFEGNHCWQVWPVLQQRRANQRPHNVKHASTLRGTHRSTSHILPTLMQLSNSNRVDISASARLQLCAASPNGKRGIAFSRSAQAMMRAHTQAYPTYGNARMNQWSAPVAMRQHARAHSCCAPVLPSWLRASFHAVVFRRPWLSQSSLHISD